MKRPPPPNAMRSLFGHNDALVADGHAMSDGTARALHNVPTHASLPDWPGLVPGMLLCGQYVLGLPLRATENAALFAAQPMSGTATAPVAVRVVRLQGALRGTAVTASLAGWTGPLARPGIQHLRASTNLGGYLFLLSDWPKGTCLHDLLCARGEGLEPDECVRLVQKLAEVIDRMHEEPRLVHRLLSPDVVYYDTQTGSVMLSDVALALGLQHEPVLARLQDAYPGYLAPEDIDSMRAPSTPARDVFVLASIAFACLTGRTAFAGATREHVAREMLSPVRPRVNSSGNKRFPAAIDVVFLRAWSLWPNARHTSAGEFAKEFALVLEGVPRTQSGVRPRVDIPTPSAQTITRPSVALGAPPVPPPPPNRAIATPFRIPVPPRDSVPALSPRSPLRVPPPAPHVPKLAQHPVAPHTSPVVPPARAVPPPPPPAAFFKKP